MGDVIKLHPEKTDELLEFLGGLDGVKVVKTFNTSDLPTMDLSKESPVVRRTAIIEMNRSAKK